MKLAASKAFWASPQNEVKQIPLYIVEKEKFAAIHKCFRFFHIALSLLI